MPMVLLAKGSLSGVMSVLDLIRMIKLTLIRATPALTEHFINANSGFPAVWYPRASCRNFDHNLGRPRLITDTTSPP